MKKLFATVLIASTLAFTGCASVSDYQLYAESQVAVARANADAQIARHNALAEIAKSGDTAAKVAAVISLNLPSAGNTNTQTVALQAPRSLGDTMLQWAAVLVNPLAQAYAVNRQSEVSIQTAKFSADTAIATTNAFVGIAGKIQAPVANVTNTNTSIVRDSGNTTTSVVRTNTTNNTNSGNTTRDSSNSTTTSTDNRVTNTNTNSGNRTDNTSTPTVVTQPTPVVVNAAASASGN